MRKLMLRRKVSQLTNWNCWIAFPINWTVWVEELRILATVSGQPFHNVSCQLLGVHELKIGHCHNLFLLSFNNLNVVIVLSRRAWKIVNFPGILPKFPMGRKLKTIAPFMTSQKEFGFLKTLHSRASFSQLELVHVIQRVNTCIAAVYHATARLWIKPLIFCVTDFLE